jgi:signal transduction histidine kinase
MISMHLQGDAREMALTISDDGKGFDVDAVWGKGLGVISMNERVEAAGGTFEIRSAPAEGSRVSVRVPLKSPVDTQPQTL